MEQEQMKIEHAFVRPELVVLWSNPENAEPGNPEGHTYGEKYFVIGEESDGSRMGHFKPYDTEEEAQKLADRVNEKLVINVEHWISVPPRYGSRAYGIEEPHMAARERYDAEHGLDY
tara:strand:+ start:67 stop:417 length:351 start_codon:yes stop_codon:yes gene_type:complete